MRYRFWKRVFDISASFLLMIVLFLPLLIIALAIKLDSKGPVFYVQERVGREGKPFLCIKLRTMKTFAPVVSRACMKNADLYVTRVGRFLRKSGIDELPQLINVLVGDMSLVGPRPLLACEEPVHSMRYRCGVYTIRPGITGLAQITERNCCSSYRRVALDYEYFCRKSFAFDLDIIFKTLKF